MDWEPLNLHVLVKVKLSPRGYQVYENYMAEINKLGVATRLIPKVDAGGWYEDQLLSIAHIFGRALYNRDELPFETEILIQKQVGAERS